MAYQQATWNDRDSEHPNRRTLTNINDPTDVKTYDISRAEGTVTTQGTPLTAANMNDLESRIASAFTEVNNNMPEANPSGAATGELEKLKVGNTIYSVEGAKPETATIQNTPIASFSDGADNVPVSELIVNITATQAGSGTPSPSNPRAISGWSECNVTKCGKNLCNFFNDGKVPSVNNGALVDYNGCRTGYIKVHPSSSYILSATSLTTPDCFIFFYDKDYNYLSYGFGNVPLTRTTPSNCCYIMLRNDSALTDIVNAQLELGSTATEYEAFNGGTDTISLGNTYYGGTLNVTTGELTIDKGYLLADGSENWQVSGSGDSQIFYLNITDMESGTNLDGLTNYIKNYSGSTAELCIRFGYNSTFIFIYSGVTLAGVTDLASFKAYLSNEPLQIVYPLATPTTVQLTPTEVRTLLEDNNIFADTGDINKLVYFKTGCEAIARLIEAYGIETEVAGTLTAGQTSITLTSDAITTNSTIDVYTDADVDYNSISVSTGSVTITFDAQASNMGVKVRIS